MPMHPRERLAYSAIEGRPPLKFPKGVRLVVWPVLALEEWDMGRPMARMVISPPQGQPMQPDHPNWSWHEYGMRVGFWRLRKMMRKLGIGADRDAERAGVRDLSGGGEGLHGRTAGSSTRTATTRCRCTRPTTSAP